MRTRRPAHTVAVLTATFSTMAASSVLVGLATGPVAADTGRSDSADHAARSDRSDQARVGRILIRGHGYGHGHGMSQYGAQGAALQGKSYRQIADFYYPGTSWAVMRGRVRVLITADTTSEVIVSPRSGLRVRDRGDGAVYRLPSSDVIKRWRLGLEGSTTVIEKLVGDSWRRWNPRGESKGALVGVGEFDARGPLTLWFPNGSTKKYRGILRAAPPYGETGSLDTVNALPMDSYLKGVVPYEMPASWHPEAVKAQAVAARTYATWSRNQNRSRYYQICDTTSCQVYGGMDGEDYRSNAAVDSTSRRILTYQGKAAFTEFSSSSGGWTAEGSAPYLTAQRDPYDGWSGNAMHSWSTSVSPSAIEQKYPRLGSFRGIRVTDRTGDGDWGGRVTRMVIDGSRGDVVMSGDSARWALGLRSNWFKFG